MNIIITIDKLDMGGAARVVYELVKNIDTTRFKLKIICIDGKVNSVLENQMIREKHDIIFLKNYRLDTNKQFSRIIRRFIFILSDIITIIKFCNEVKKSKPDIVHAHHYGIWAAYWTIFHNIPMVTTVHTNPSATFTRDTEKIILQLSILLHRNIFIAISKYNLELIKSYWHLHDKYACYVNNGIAIDDFYTRPHETVTFINVSRQDENKNQSLILKAFSKLYKEDTAIPMKLYLIGGGVTHEALKQEAASLGIDSLTVFSGYVPSAVNYLADSDVYISSSHREGLPLSVLEAMASSLPIIATDVGGVRDLTQENGILIGDNDTAALYAAMKELRDNPALRIAKGKKSLEMVQAYSVSAMAKGYEAIYEKYAKKSKASSE